MTKIPSAARFAQYVPVAAVIVGFALIGLGWNGAASLDYVQGQIPYLISGGLAGLGLVFFGTAGMVVQAIKRQQSRQMEELGDLTRTMQRVATALSVGMNGGGHGENGSSEMVVAGSSSFHLPSCRTVGKRKEVIKVPRDTAIEEGLEPCRICNP